MKLVYFLIFLSTALGASGSREEDIISERPTEASSLDHTSAILEFPQWDRSVVPGADTRELWGRLASASDSETMALLEMILRRASPGSDESAIAHAELGLLLYENKLYLKAGHHLDMALQTIENNKLRLKRLEIGAFYEQWSRDRLATELRQTFTEGLSGRDADVVKLIIAKTLWSSLDLKGWGLSEASISALARDGDDIWGGTWNGGIFRFTRSTGSARVFRTGAFQPVPNAVVSVLVDPFAVWFASLDGLHRYHKVTEQWRTWPLPAEVQPERVQGVFRIHGKFYLATLGFGLWHLDRNDWIKVNLNGVSEQINVLKEAGGDTAWVGTRDRGLFLWNTSLGGIRRIDVSSGPSPRNITSVQAKDQDLWVGTYGEGLFYYKAEEKTFQRFSKSQGTLPDDWVMTLRMVDDILFIGTFGGGISLVMPDGKWHFLQDFASPADVVALEPHRNILYIGTLREGLYLLYLEALRALP